MAIEQLPVEADVREYSEEEIEESLDSIGKFLDDPVALLERAILLFKARTAHSAALIALGLAWGLDEWGRGAFAILNALLT